jgi:UDP-N-acetylglucosamine acyltransferase
LKVPQIDSSARVADGARVADDVEIGPFCIVGPDVELRAGVRLVSHVNVAGHTIVGERTVVHPFASLGTAPQSTGYRGEPTRLVIGADCTIRESVTMNIGTQDGRGITEVGDRGFYMAYSHVGHDCQVGSDVVFANGAALGGHCIVGEYVFIGGLAAVHQFSRIGPHAIIAGVSGVRADVIPFGAAAGVFARLRGLNMVGMRRRKFSSDSIRALRAAYRTLFLGKGTLAQRLDRATAEFGDEPNVAKVLAFVRDRRSRPLCLPGNHEADAG